MSETNVTNKDKTQAQEALEIVKKNHYKLGVDGYLMPDELKTIRKALTILDLLEDAEARGVDVIPVWNENMDEAPRDGSEIIVKTKHHNIAEYGGILPKEFYSFYSARYEPPHESFDGEITEYEGAFWILNDDEKQLIEGEEDVLYSWKPLPTPEQQEILKKIKVML
jgi:hypothetical protein